MRAIMIESEGAAPRLREDADESILTGEVGLDVLATGVNYKDAMALAGKGIARTHPLIPGIDLVGRVTESVDERFSAGDLVVLNGDGIGESAHGGFATRARVRPDALVRLPAALSPDRAAAIDGVGSTTLANVLAQTSWGGTVAAYGLVQGPDLPTTVLPFILRGVTLAGINSVECPLPQRERAWDALAEELDGELLDSMTTGIGLSEVIDHAERVLAGEVRGRTVIDVGA